MPIASRDNRMWLYYLYSLIALSLLYRQSHQWFQREAHGGTHTEDGRRSWPELAIFCRVPTCQVDHEISIHLPRSPRTDGPVFIPGLWDTLTMSACAKALEPFRKAATNPSGLAMCYNIPFLDNSTGVFQSELRILRVSGPVGLWRVINESSVHLGLSFADATIQASTVPGFTSRPSNEMFPLKVRAASSNNREEDISILHIFHFVGQIREEVLRRPMTLRMLHEFVAPQVTVGATTSADIQISDLLSLADASFVSGELVRHEPLLFLYRDKFVFPASYIRVFPTGMVLVLSWFSMSIVLAAYRQYRCNQIKAEDLYKLSRGEDIELETLQGL